MVALVKRILVVDDEPEVVGVLRDLLAAMSELHVVETLSEGGEALEAVREPRLAGAAAGRRATVGPS